MTKRYVTYSPDVAHELCERIASGRTLADVCRDDDMPHRVSVSRWLVDDDPAMDDFRKRYAMARQLLVEYWADQIIDIADDGSQDYEFVEGKEVFRKEHVQRSRLMIDSRKWLMCKLKPGVYGDKVTNEVKVDGASGPVAPVIRLEFGPGTESETARAAGALLNKLSD